MRLRMGASCCFSPALDSACPAARSCRRPGGAPVARSSVCVRSFLTNHASFTLGAFPMGAVVTAPVAKPATQTDVVIETRKLTKVYRDFWGRQKVRSLNAQETLDFYGRLFNMPKEVRRERTAKLIDMVKLNWAKRRQLREYSKG